MQQRYESQRAVTARNKLPHDRADRIGSLAERQSGIGGHGGPFLGGAGTRCVTVRGAQLGGIRSTVSTALGYLSSGLPEQPGRCWCRGLFSPFMPSQGNCSGWNWLGLTISWEVLREIVQLLDRFMFTKTLL
jgi:hypothetical protein